MDNEIESFLEVDEIEEDEELINVTVPKHSKLYKFIIIVICLAIFASTTFIGLKLQGKAEANADISTICTDIASTAEKTVSDKYKIRTLAFPDNSGSYISGQVNITKDDIHKLNKVELEELFNFLNSRNEFNFITIKFSDDTGILVLPGNNSTYFYGRINENGLISKLTGTVIYEEEKGYSYYVNNTEVIISQHPTDTGVTANFSESTEDYDNSEVVYITASGTKYHKNGCSYLSKSMVSISLEKAISGGYSPCSRCIE